MSDGFAALILLAIILNIPMCLRALRAMSPLAIDPTVTRFTGRHHGWHVATVTGRVDSSQTRNVTYGSYQLQHLAASDTVIGTTSFHTDSYDQFVLIDGTGRPHPVSALNFYAVVRRGDVVTVAWARRGGKNILFTVLNHTTNTAHYNDVWLNTIGSPRHVLLVFWIFVSVFTVIGVIPTVTYVVAMKGQLRRFKSSGVRPLVGMANYAAGNLPRAT